MNAAAPPPPPVDADAVRPRGGAALREVAGAFLRLGLTSFGGPVAHLGYFREEFVVRRRWLSDAAYAELVALCQFLPGPASSQVGMALGLQRAGYAGALAAWAGFTLPSAIALILLALGLSQADLAHPLAQGTLRGLKAVAVAVVAQAVWGMARQLCPDTRRRLLALATAAAALLWPTSWTQVGLMVLAAVLGASGGLRLPAPAGGVGVAAACPVSVRAGVLWLALFALLLLGLPLAVQGDAAARPVLALVDAFYRAGALVFGGGHVVLPLLQAEVVSTGWVTEDAFLAGYGATQAVPGPLFSFAAFLGAARADAPNGGAGGLIALLAIFAPAFLLLAGALPFWARLKALPRARSATAAVNAAVVGLLLAALIYPVAAHGLRNVADLLLVGLALVALLRWHVAPWAVVLASAAGGAALAVLRAW